MNRNEMESPAENGLSVAALRKREEIKSAAKQLFARQGFAATSIRQIASQANLEGGSLIVHLFTLSSPRPWGCFQ